MKENTESTSTLLMRIKSGDEAARERLFNTYLPVISRWAHGRLPQYARDLSETADMVQASLMKALEHVDHFEAVREGAFLAYLRQILLNHIRMEIRRVSRRQKHGHADSEIEVPDMEASVMQQAIGDEALQRYEKGLMELKPQAREAVILRIEFGYTFNEIANAVEMNSSNAARMLVSRSLAQVARHMS